MVSPSGPDTDEFMGIPSSPDTDEFMDIPSSPYAGELKPNLSCVFHGFGYDQLRDDYKVIQYISFNFHTLPTKSFLEIYSLKSNSWRMIDMDNVLFNCNFPNPFFGLEVYVDGACHWLVNKLIKDGPYEISLLSFDLSDEVFLTTPIGKASSFPYNRHLAVLNGSIALISSYVNEIVFQISILGELGVSESWIKLYTCGSFPSIQWPPIGFGKMGYIYVKKNDYELAYVNLSTQIIEKIGITGGQLCYVNVGLYKESLLSFGGSSN
ncbi:F-box/kelch-repeat protein At3g06240-like [Vicia villosa]|uniref:F-box/kelch-repeat protein At3g06240-like n=1 Tax=Vicia villosa TaxID=3911 RepID=UPI00273C1642|nr:F-box/kelch-repeat protein At3g06240-like [Vicia villosa]